MFFFHPPQKAQACTRTHPCASEKSRISMSIQCICCPSKTPQQVSVGVVCIRSCSVAVRDAPTSTPMAHWLCLCSTRHALPILCPTQAPLTFVPVSSTVRLRLLHCLIIDCCVQKGHRCNKRLMMKRQIFSFQGEPQPYYMLGTSPKCFVCFHHRAPSQFFAPGPAHSRQTSPTQG